MKSRLTRLAQVHTEQLFYFLTFCTSERRAILANSAIESAFHDFCQAALSRDIFVGRYVIMPDHIHVFVAFKDQEQLSVWIKSLKNSLSKTLRSRGEASPHWQKGFFDHLMRTEDSYGTKREYVRQDPVRQSLVSDASTWPFQGQINDLSFR